MKLFCQKNYIKEAVSLCEKITGKNLNLPILSDILIIGENKKIKLISTNLELGIEIDIPSKIEQEGRIAVPSSIINNFLSNIIKDEKITLESQNNNLLISTYNSSTLIKSHPTDDFPTLPVLKSDNLILIPIEDFISGLKSVWYACSFSNIKPEISSVFLFSDKNNNITFTATDSFRLAEKKFNYFFPDLGPLLVPFKTIAEILRIFDGKSGKIKMSFNKNQINLELDNIKFISRLVDGVFPDYQQIIPKKFITDVIIDKEDFVNSLKMASVFSGKLNELSFVVNPDDELLTIKTSNSDTGEHVAKIRAQITGDEIKIVFNYKYIFDCLSSINSQQIILRFSGEGKPLLITSTKNDMFQYLIMPMSV